MTEFSSADISNLPTSLDMPTKLLPIVIIGAGGIISDAHLPAYKKAGFKVLGIYDPIKEKAENCQKNFGIEKICENVNTFIQTIKQSKPTGAKGTFIKKISISSTMGVSLNCEII